MKVKIRPFIDLVAEYGIEEDCIKNVACGFLVDEMEHLCENPCEIKRIEKVYLKNSLNSSDFVITIIDFKHKNTVWTIPAYILEPVDRALVEAHIENLKRSTDESKD